MIPQKYNRKRIFQSTFDYIASKIIFWKIAAKRLKQCKNDRKRRINSAFGQNLVGVKGLEPPASCSQSRRATNCATPRFYQFFIRFISFCFLRNVRSASLKNIVVLLAWSASHYSLFFHLRVPPVSSPGRGDPLRPTALHPDFINFSSGLFLFAFCVTSAALPSKT